MPSKAIKQEEPKSWETLYRNGDTREDKGQYNLFRLYKDMGVLRSIDKLKEYCDNPDNKEELEEKQVSYPANRRTYYRWKDKFHWDERINDEVSYIAQKTTEETLQYNIQQKKMEIQYSTQLTQIKQRILTLLDKFLTEIEQGNTQYIAFTKACTQMTTKLNETNHLSNNMINNATTIIGNLNKALHPEDVRGGLPSLAESIEQSIQKLGEPSDDNQ